MESQSENPENDTLRNRYLDKIKVSVHPEPSLLDTGVDISAKGLPPSQRFTFYSKAENGKDLFECLAVYTSNQQGEIDLSRDASRGGFFLGVEPMGLFWALQSYSVEKMQNRLLKRDVSTPLIVTIGIHFGHFETLQEFHQHSTPTELIHFQVTRLFIAPGTRRIEVKEAGLLGTLFLPPGKGPFPGLVNMFGGMSGTLEYKPALFASHGFAALALPYSGLEGLPESFFSLDLEYFEMAVDYLCRHESVDASQGVGVVGVCKGGEIALAMAESLKQIKCVVAVNCAVLPAHTTYKYKKKVRETTNIDPDFVKKAKQGSLIFRHTFPMVGRSCNDAELKSTLFKFHPSISYMYIAGLDDDDLPSEFYCNVFENALKSQNHPSYTILRYPGGGHLIESPHIPHCAESYFSNFDTFLRYGGEPLAHHRAQVDSWKEQIRFLHDNLNRTRTKANL